MRGSSASKPRSSVDHITSPMTTRSRRWLPTRCSTVTLRPPERARRFTLPRILCWLGGLTALEAPRIGLASDKGKLGLGFVAGIAAAGADVVRGVAAAAPVREVGIAAVE